MIYVNPIRRDGETFYAIEIDISENIKEKITFVQIVLRPKTGTWAATNIGFPTEGEKKLLNDLKEDAIDAILDGNCSIENV